MISWDLIRAIDIFMLFLRAFFSKVYKKFDQTDVKFIDFGSATSISKKESYFKMVGSVPFISPEVLLRMDWSIEADIFAFG